MLQMKTLKTKIKKFSETYDYSASNIQATRTILKLFEY